MKTLKKKREGFMHITKAFFWFAAGAALSFFLLTSFTFIIFEKINSNVVYPGIYVKNIDLGGKTESEISQLFKKDNENIGNVQFTFSDGIDTATISAKELGFGYDHDLIAKQAISIGRSERFLSNVSLAFQAYIDGLTLRPAYHYSEDKLKEILSPFVKRVNKEPIDALFNFQNGKVTTFKPSEEGVMIDIEEIKKNLNAQFEKVLSQTSQAWPQKKPQTIKIPVSMKIIQPKISTDKANNLGIKELIGKGTSVFYHSIQSRIFNLTLAASRINNVLIAPKETFSFNKALGDVSSFTGYKQAYIIQNGKTILGDGGGVCQVSTTFFRAILNAGLPITERHAHAYRVGYYEGDSPPGLDATIYVPSVDLKFKNDTENYILVQTEINQDLQQLSVFLYGTSDGRVVNITKPIISNRTPPPPDLYQDDPTLPKGVVKQIDYKAEGSRVSFSREVTKNGKRIISDTYVSNYAPWQSVFLRGTKE
ncbi:MAG: VanW family protein [Candidatus Levybacteria bacterium]|nr:VanW family protein [Candidatus Levybacteria bacterium]